jgi:hypothetical protein
VDTGGVVLRSLLVGHLDEVLHLVVVTLELAAEALDETVKKTAMFRHTTQGAEGRQGEGAEPEGRKEGEG